LAAPRSASRHRHGNTCWRGQTVDYERHKRLVFGALVFVLVRV
jgi:hypothetical protein